MHWTALLVTLLLLCPVTDGSAQAPPAKGAITKFTWESRIFPGSFRNYWVYAPAQYRAETPAALMVFQDGEAFSRENGEVKTPAVMDRLIAAGQMPITIGVFVDPGILRDASGRMIQKQRSLEYDALGDRYVRFLLEEILPEVDKRWNITRDPNLRGIGGASSGGIAAFTAAWERPDVFRRVLCFIGSFTNLKGGETYQSQIRKTEPKPLRIFLQDGSNDLNTYSGNWWLANQAVHASLLHAGYDVEFLRDEGGHGWSRPGQHIEAGLRWLWKNWTAPITKPRGAKQTASLVIAGEWELVGQGHDGATGLSLNARGDVAFTDARGKRFRVGPDGKVAPVGQPSVGVGNGGVAVTSRGRIYSTEPGKRRIWLTESDGARRVVHVGLQRPTGLALSQDEQLLYVTDHDTRWVWSFQLLGNGALANGAAWVRLENPDDAPTLQAGGMTVDTEGMLYVATNRGVQGVNVEGKVEVILNKPQPSAVTSVSFGGPELKWLYVTTGDKLYRRPMTRQGHLPGQVRQ